MASVIAAIGPCEFQPRPDHSHFHHLARAVVYQQLSTKAATTIFGRVRGLCGESLDPDRLLAHPPETLRAAGLSTPKTRYLREMAGRVLDGSLTLEGIEERTDAEVIAQLTTLNGIGVWSAQMFLIFRLGRPDVLPILDLGIRKAVQRAYGYRSLPALRTVARLGKRWSPYATIASWYLWRSVDGPAA